YRYPFQPNSGKLDPPRVMKSRGQSKLKGENKTQSVRLNYSSQNQRSSTKRDYTQMNLQKYDPVGSYRRTFTVPDNWGGRKVFIHFGGVKSAFYIWVNGHKVGYSEGSMTPAEFDLTPYLQE